MKIKSLIDKIILQEMKLLSEEVDIKSLISKYENNPYSIGANVAVLKNDYMIFRFSSAHYRRKAINKLKSMGIPTNKMRNIMQLSTFKFRYELIVLF